MRRSISSSTKFGLLQHSRRAGIAGANDVVAIIGLAFDRLAAAGDDEGSGRLRRGYRERERVKARLDRWIDLGTDIAARHRIDAVSHHAPFDQRLDVNLVEGPKTLFGERRGRTKLAGAERRDRPPGLFEDLGDPRKTRFERHRVGEPHPLDGEIFKCGNAAGILADARYETIAAVGRFD